MGIFGRVQSFEMTILTKQKESIKSIDKQLLWRAYELMQVSKSLAELYEENKDVCSKYVHSTSRGHEAIQLATGLQLTGTRLCGTLL
jgi:2-oxoisovalerate dehydrogenase E1 component